MLVFKFFQEKLTIDFAENSWALRAFLNGTFFSFLLWSKFQTLFFLVSKRARELGPMKQGMLRGKVQYNWPPH